MTVRPRRSAVAGVIFGCSLLAILVATLMIVAPFGSNSGYVDSAGPHPDDAIVTGNTQGSGPACDAEHSLAGRELEIDTKGGPHYGTVQFSGSLPLRDKEVVLTFDDGPHATRTRPILDVLDRYCVKAVFFVVGAMVMENPDVLREVARRGHVIGTHSFAHPFNMTRMSKQQALEQIDGGFAAVSHVLGGPVAPLFRFPGLFHSHELLSELSGRDISVWSVDIVTDDSFVGAARMTERLFHRLGKDGRGMVLMHDIKKSTVDSLPGILQTLKAQGYTVPRIAVAPTVTPDERLMATLDQPKPQWGGLLHRASQKSGHGPARTVTRPSARFEPFHLDGPAFPMQ